MYVHLTLCLCPTPLHNSMQMCDPVSMSQLPLFWSHTLVRVCTCIITCVDAHLTPHICSIHFACVAPHVFPSHPSCKYLSHLLLALTGGDLGQ